MTRNTESWLILLAILVCTFCLGLVSGHQIDHHRHANIATELNELKDRYEGQRRLTGQFRSIAEQEQETLERVLAKQQGSLSW
jgi:hypothetical protein